MKKRLITAVAMAAAGAVMLAGCASGGSGGEGDSGGDIIVGSVNTLSGPETFAEASQAADAVFDEYNKKGGLDGRHIKYVSKDDAQDLQKASTLAKEIVNDDQAVVMAGGASQVECQANADFYDAKKILSIPGIGVDANCFDSPSISPANVGPFNDTTLALTYGSEVLGLDHLCVLLVIVGNTKPAYEAAITKWEKATGKSLFYEDATVPSGAADYTPYLVKARAKGCEAVMTNTVGPESIAMLKNAHAMGWSDVTWLQLTSVYSTEFAEAVSDAGEGLYVPAEFYPFTDVNEQTKQWRDLMQANDIKLTAFSQGGFLAAKHVIHVLEQLHADGKDITRENVTEALHQLTGDKAIKNPMIGTPYTFGTASKHDQNTCGWPIQLMSGTNKWEDAAKGGDDWLCIPE